MAERWKKIEDCIGNYEVSDCGRVRNVNTGKVLAPRKTKTGYLRVHVRLNGKGRDTYIHRLVAEAFCARQDGHNVINHIDNNPQNNRADNLEWTTQFDNVHYGMKQGRYRLNAKSVLAIKDGTIQQFVSAHQASIALLCDSSTITGCCKGKNKTHHGYEFRYAEV